MWSCFFCFNTNVENDNVLNDSLAEIAEITELKNEDYSDDDDDDQNILENLHLKTLYDDSRLLTTVFIITVGYSILLSLFFYSIVA